MGSRIIGCGKALPQRVVSNDDLAEIVDTSDEWIYTRTGIKNRRIAIEETTTDLGCAAAERALGWKAGGWRLADDEIDPASIDLLVCMTITADMVVPSQAALLKARLGLTNAVAFDLNAACAGCIYGLDVASSMLELSAFDGRRAAESGSPRTRNAMKRALVVGAERLTRLVDWTDRSTCVLFGDGAGAVLLEWQDDAPGILSSFLKNTDDADGVLVVPNFFDMSTFPFADVPRACGELSCAGMRVDADDETVGALRAAGCAEPIEGMSNPLIGMQGQAVFKFATSAMTEAAKTVCARADVPLSEVKCIVPHQANERIIRYAAKKLGVPEDLFQVSIAEVGNTSASSVLMALADAFVGGRIEKGDAVLLVGFGGGLTSGAILFRA